MGRWHGSSLKEQRSDQMRRRLIQEAEKAVLGVSTTLSRAPLLPEEDDELPDNEGDKDDVHYKPQSSVRDNHPRTYCLVADTVPPEINIQHTAVLPQQRWGLDVETELGLPSTHHVHVYTVVNLCLVCATSRCSILIQCMPGELVGPACRQRTM